MTAREFVSRHKDQMRLFLEAAYNRRNNVDKQIRTNNPDRQSAREFMPNPHEWQVDTLDETTLPGFLQNLTDFTGPFADPGIQDMRKSQWKNNEELAPQDTVKHGLLVDRSHSVFGLLHRLSFFGLPADAFFGPIRFNPEGTNVTVYGPVFEPDFITENVAREKVLGRQWDLMSVSIDYRQETVAVTLRERDDASLRPKRVTITYRVAGATHRA